MLQKLKNPYSLSGSETGPNTYAAGAGPNTEVKNYLTSVDRSMVKLVGGFGGMGRQRSSRNILLLRPSFTLGKRISSF